MKGLMVGRTRNDEGMKWQISALALRMSWRKSPTHSEINHSIINNILAIFSHVTLFFQDVFPPSKPLYSTHLNILICQNMWFLNKNFSKAYHGYLTYIFFFYLNDSKHMLIQLLRGKMISQQLLDSPVPLCDESFKLPQLKFTSEEGGGFLLWWERSGKN